MTCVVYGEEKKSNQLTPEREAEFKEHMDRKVEARKEKYKDKKDAEENDKVYVAAFDMEAVLTAPSNLTSIMYYKRKLSVYNLTVFSLGNKDATCYLCNETEGQRGSNEVGTCLYKHILSLPKTIEHVILYSDTCGGQNRNQCITAALHHAVKTIPNIKTIDQKFLESGPSQMECDTVHACIERQKKRVQINHPHDLNLLISTNQKVKWLKIKWIRVTKEDKDTIYFKYRIPDQQFRQIKIQGTSRRRGRPRVQCPLLTALYTDRLPISDAKKKDLEAMCDSLVVPRSRHAFYRDFSCSSSVKDRLTEVDLTEEQDDTDED